MRAWVFVLVAGCHFRPAGIAGDTARDGAPDAPPDIAIDTFDPLCFGSGPFIVCLPALPTTPLTITSIIYASISSPGKCHSDLGVVLPVNGIPACVFAGTTVSVNALSTGALPIVLVASDSISIAALDARGSRVYGPGPNSNPTQCGDPTATIGADATTGAGGGAGGTFVVAGGDGGAGSIGAAAAGTTIAAQDSLLLRGGCPGGAGGIGLGARAPGGSGGGAVFAVARTSIGITGALTVSGAGGTGGASSGGGGGGGAGGLLVLDAPSLVIDPAARIMANGGGGGGGDSGAVLGGDGADATTLGVAMGGAAASSATAGGDGGFGTTAARSSTQAVVGGGGGGGAVGVIRVLSGQTLPATNTSPPQT